MPKKSFIALWVAYRAYLTSTFLIFVCIISFQNCSQPLEEGEGSGESSSLSDTTPFAYDVSIDHLAMMTCNTSGVSQADPKGQFTYKWGAYKNGLASASSAGLKLSSNFMDKYGQYVPAKVFTILEDSVKNKDLHLVSGFYNLGEYSKNLGVNSSPDKYVNDYGKLQINSFRKQMALNSKSSHAFFSDVQVGTGLTRGIEGRLFRHNYSSGVPPLKDEFSSIISSIKSKPLSLGFAHAGELTGNAKPLIAESGSYDGATAVGRSYRMEYGQIAGVYDRYLTAVIEKKLDNTSSSSSWVCPTSLRFKIVNRKDIESNLVTCNPIAMTPESIQSNASYRSIANVIDLSVWEVDVSRKCIVRRGSSTLDPCYNPSFNKFVNDDNNFESVQATRVDYNLSKCATSSRIHRETIGGQPSNTFYMCPHYISICVRPN